MPNGPEQAPPHRWPRVVRQTTAARAQRPCLQDYYRDQSLSVSANGLPSLRTTTAPPTGPTHPAPAQPQDTTWSTRADALVTFHRRDRLF
jgi:hypothetical protein